MKPQTFWNDFISEDTLPTFKSWVGGPEAPSKRYFYDHLLQGNHKNMLDLGCGDCTILQGILTRNIDIEYQGIDSCSKFCSEKVIEADIRKVPFEDSSYDLVFGRHVLEHQNTFEILLEEMIRLASKEVIHIFFIKPTSTSSTKYFEFDSRGLCHNNYNKRLIQEYLENHPKVDSFFFKDLNQQEEALHIQIKE